jgi:alpha-N-acetylglucosaminidase
VWYDWPAWEEFIDWMALAGHNSIVAPTGQEEVQYKILTEQFGVSDMEVRNWTNGPAFLTWSRGQNSHGNGIAGPLPRSFMKGQWNLQRQILARYRELGIAGHQPAFGGYSPWALAVKQNDKKATRGVGGARDTAWLGELSRNIVLSSEHVII